MDRPRVGFAVCGSFCTLDRALKEMEALAEEWDLYPVASPIVQRTDTRFGRAEAWLTRMETAAGRPVVRTVAEAEPIGPKKLLDALVIAPCTGNTLAKLAAGVTDTSVTMAAKAHLRNGRPLILAPATNDALGAAARNIGALLNARGVYFVPMAQDDPDGKPTSVIADFSRIRETVEAALAGRQVQPVLLSPSQKNA